MIIELTDDEAKLFFKLAAYITHLEWCNYFNPNLDFNSDPLKSNCICGLNEILIPINKIMENLLEQEFPG